MINLQMREILTQMPINTTDELALFEREIVKLTLGHSIKRCMAYTDFRRSIQELHQTRLYMSVKCILAQNHFISAEDGVATLYRHIEEDNTDDIDHDGHDVDDTIDDKPKKRVKSGHK